MDNFYGIKRLTEKIGKKHGGQASFSTSITLALTPPLADDVRETELLLIAEGKDNQQIEAIKKTREWFKFYLKHARRSSGKSRMEQLKRFDNVINAYKV